jgi:ABC-type branched-subunit amino acid transport system permease subunit
MSRFSKPLIALALAIVPFFLFLGTTDMVTVNGEVVSDNRFNLGGLVMAVIGIGIVFGVLRSGAPTDLARKVLAVVAGLLVGVVESLVRAYHSDIFPNLATNTGTLAPYVLMMVVLLVRPHGLFGTKEVERV